MRAMRRLQIAVVMMCLGLLAGCTMWGKQQKGWSGATSGEQLERLWWEDVKSQRFEDLERHIAASFVGMAPDATLDRAGLIQRWRQLSVTDYSLGDFVTQLNGDDLTLSYRANFSGAQGTNRWRVLSVWQHTPHGWILIAQSFGPDTSK